MEIEKGKIIFEELYKDLDGIEISLNERKRLQIDDKTLVYGEVLFDEFVKLLKKAGLQKNDIFYDLGCGLGKPNVIAALVFEPKKSIGIELLHDLFEKAKEVSKKFKEILPGHPTLLDFKRNDFLKENFSDADFVFSHATCFTKEQIEKLEKKFLKLKKGATIILATKRLDNEIFRLVEKEKYYVSWGSTDFYIYKKIV